MKIVFCSNYRGQTGVTSSMLSVAVLSDILYDKRSLLLQTQARQNQLEVPLLDLKKRKYLLEDSRGMEQLAEHILSGGRSKELFSRCCTALADSSVHFISRGGTMEDFLYEDAVGDSLKEMLYMAEDLYESIFIDAGVMPEKIAEVLYQEADKIVVCLNQNKRVLDDFFYFGHKSSKMLYIINGYDHASIYGKERLLTSYKEMNQGNTFFVPYNTDMRDAFSESKLFSYFYRNIASERSEPNFEFIHTMLKLTRYINQ